MEEHGVACNGMSVERKERGVAMAWNNRGSAIATAESHDLRPLEMGYRKT